MRSDNNQSDMFDGVWDDPATKRRVVYRDGKVVRFAAKNMCGDCNSFWEVLWAPWGHYCAPPNNGGVVSACIES
jgi:hypothetical protein